MAKLQVFLQKNGLRFRDSREGAIPATYMALQDMKVEILSCNSWNLATLFLLNPVFVVPLELRVPLKPQMVCKRGELARRGAVKKAGS